MFVGSSSRLIFLEMDQLDEGKLTKLGRCDRTAKLLLAQKKWDFFLFWGKKVKWIVAKNLKLKLEAKWFDVGLPSAGSPVQLWESFSLSQPIHLRNYLKVFKCSQIQMFRI